MSIAGATVLANFDQPWSPRIVAQVNDYDVRIAKVSGEHVWHAHEGTDEFFPVLEGTFHIALRDAVAEHAPGERVVTLERGAVFVVPKAQSTARSPLVEPRC